MVVYRVEEMRHRTLSTGATNDLRGKEAVMLLSKAIDRVYKELANMPTVEFHKLLEQHAEGDIAKILREVWCKSKLSMDKDRNCDKDEPDEGCNFCDDYCLKEE